MGMTTEREAGMPRRRRLPPSGGGSLLGEGAAGPRRVGVHVQLAVEGETHLPVAPDHVGDALDYAEDRPAHVVGADDPLLRVADERVGQAQALPEAVVRLLGIPGHADDLAARRLEVVVL